MQKFIIVRGLPGSGKSTLAKSLCVDETWQHFEADQYFMIDGEYKWVGDDVPKAQRWCQRSLIDSLGRGYNTIVSNVSINYKDMLPYLDLAKDFEIEPQILTCHGNFGSIHSIPQHRLDRLARRWVSTENILREYSKLAPVESVILSHVMVQGAKNLKEYNAN